MSIIKKFITLKFVLALGIIFLCFILYFDFWIYKKFVLNVEERARKEGAAEEIFLLKTPLLEKAADEIRKKDEFLQNPKYPLIKNPF